MNNLKNHNCYTLSRNSNRCDVCGARFEERPKGKWEYTDGRCGLGDWRCSKCGDYSNKDTHYCPNCGADMRGDV